MRHPRINKLLLPLALSAFTLGAFADANAQEREFDMASMQAYADSIGYGYDFNTAPDKKNGGRPFYFSVNVPDGNYRVTLLIGDKKRASNTTVRAESRRLMLENVKAGKGRYEQRSFIVSKRSTAINPQDSVRINPREVGTPTWDDKLSLEFTGENPAVAKITIERVDDAPTVFLCGNSTVVDQVNEPWASWGQIIPRYFNGEIAVANHAESGERTSSFIASKRLDKVMSMAKAGDWILIEFGHNDQKDKGPGSGAYYNFAHNLKIFIDRARQADLKPVLITPTARRHFNENGKIKNTHGDYPDAMREVAQRENVPLIELNEMTKTLYESLGVEGSKQAFVHYPANTFPGQSGALADNTHFNPYGATQVAKCVIEGIRQQVPELAAFLIETDTFSPSHPDDPSSFVWPSAPFFDAQKPYGN